VGEDLHAKGVHGVVVELGRLVEDDSVLHLTPLVSGDLGVEIGVGVQEVDSVGFDGVDTVLDGVLALARRSDQ